MGELRPPQSPEDQPTLFHRLIRWLVRPVHTRLETAESTLRQHHELIVAGRAQAELVNTQTSTRLDAVSQRVEHCEAGIRNNEQRLGELGASQNELDAAIRGQLNDARSILEAGIRNNEQRLGELGANQNELNAAIRGQLNDARSVLEADIRSAVQRLDELGRHQDELTAAIRDLSRSVTQERERDLRELTEAARKTGAEIDQFRGDVLPRLHLLSGFQTLAEGKLAQWDAQSGELRSRIENDSRRLDGVRDQLGELLPPGTNEFDYTGFEDRFRGSEALIAERQSVYLPLLAGRAPVADLGCGRGELLELLKTAGIEAVGVDSDAAQAARCRAKGLNVEQAELMQWVGARGSGSLGALVALQVVEHLSFVQCIRLIEQAHRALRPDGIVLFETVNPHCPEAMEWFYIDPTHRRPVYPELLRFLLEQQGFVDVSVRFHVPTSTAIPGEPLNDKTGGDFSITGIRK